MAFTATRRVFILWGIPIFTVAAAVTSVLPAVVTDLLSTSSSVPMPSGVWAIVLTTSLTYAVVWALLICVVLTFLRRPNGWNWAGIATSALISWLACAVVMAMPLALNHAYAGQGVIRIVLGLAVSNALWKLVPTLVTTLFCCSRIAAAHRSKSTPS